METIEDIVAEMRCGMIPKHRHDRELLLNFSNRIEAAVKALEADRDNWRRQALDEDARANAATCEKSSQVGNAAKMREVVAETEKRIDKCISILTEIPDSCGYGGLLEDAADELCELKEQFIKPALAAPARNCDLYRTKKEQNAAYKKYREYVIMSNSNPFIAQDEMMSKEEWLLA
jgi:hypothetical protein